MFSLGKKQKTKEIHNLYSIKELPSYDWNTVKDYMDIRIYNYIAFSNSIPDNVLFYKWMDLAIAYVVNVCSEDGDTMLYHLFTESDAKELGVTKKEIKEAAFDNTNHDPKFRLLTFSEAMASANLFYPLLIKHPMAELQMAEDVPMVLRDVKAKGMPFEDNSETEENVLVMTAKNKAFGSKFMCLSDKLDKAVQRFKGDNFYIIPLDIHQLMLVRSKYATHEGKKSIEETEDDLLDMLEEYNDQVNTNVSNVLSYKIYYYSGDDGKMVFPISKRKGT